MQEIKAVNSQEYVIYHLQGYYEEVLNQENYMYIQFSLKLPMVHNSLLYILLLFTQTRTKNEQFK